MAGKSELENLPYLAFQAVVKNLKARDFFRLRRSSKALLDKCDSSRHHPVMEVDFIDCEKDQLYYSRNRDDYQSIPLNSRVIFDAYALEVSDSDMKIVLDHIRQSRVQAFRLLLGSTKNLEPEILRELIKTLKVSEVDIERKSNQQRALCDLKFQTLSMSMEMQTFNDDIFIRWNMKEIYLTGNGITARGINAYLKQFLSGSRVIGKFHYYDTHPQWNVEDILKDIDANLVWSDDSHKDSLMSNVNIVDFDSLPIGVYSLWRPGDFTKPIYIEIRNSLIEITAINHWYDTDLDEKTLLTYNIFANRLGL